MDLSIYAPRDGQLTVYSKSGCPNCSKVKTFLKDKYVKFVVVDCDDYILQDKTRFLTVIQQLSGTNPKTFPFIFDGKTFIGGFAETIKYLDRLFDFDLSF